MEQERVTIRDIAEELGLSTATVSNVIHGKTGKVSDETVKRVQALLEERQYIPSMAGILLAQNASRIIGVFVNDHEKYEGHTLDDVFIASSLNALSTEIEAHGQFMMVKKANNPDEILQFASMWNMDGLVVIGFCRQDYMYLRSHMRIPFVVYDGFCEKPERIVNITIDNLDGCGTERIDGFKKGFGAERTRVMVVPMRKEERWAYYRQKREQFHQISAVFAVSDYYAIDLIRFLNENGFAVPKDVSVAGFDDIPMCEMISPALTTVRQDGALRAKIAIEKLHELKENRDTETTITLPVQLVERESTGQYTTRRD